MRLNTTTIPALTVIVAASLIIIFLVSTLIGAGWEIGSTFGSHWASGHLYQGVTEIEDIDGAVCPPPQFGGLVGKGI